MRRVVVGVLIVGLAFSGGVAWVLSRDPTQKCEHAIRGSIVAQMRPGAWNRDTVMTLSWEPGRAEASARYGGWEQQRDVPEDVLRTVRAALFDKRTSAYERDGELELEFDCDGSKGRLKVRTGSGLRGGLLENLKECATAGSLRCVRAVATEAWQSRDSGPHAVARISNARRAWEHLFIDLPATEASEPAAR